MYTLYYSPGTASLAVHWMLIELGVPFELALTDIKAGAQKSPAYLRLNPTGHVPALVIDGTAYAECAALLMLLAERHPEAHFAPLPNSPERAAFVQTMFYLANTLMPAFRAFFYTDEIAGPRNTEAVIEHATRKIEAVWDRIDTQLADGRTFLVGEQMTAADFLATMLTRWSRAMPKPATTWPHLSAYVNRMRAHQSLREVHAREGLTDWING